MPGAKDDLRQEMRAARAAIPEARRAEAAQRVAAGVRTQLEGRVPRGALAYAATSEELDPSVLVRSLLGSGVRVAYPRVCAPGELTLHWAGEDELEPGYCGLLEPTVGCAPAALDAIDLVIVPGVAFDAHCHRLGMGGGFYDRLLARMPSSALAIGIAFDEQMVESVPCEEHDRPLHAVVTPGWYFRPGSEPVRRP